MKKKTKTKTTGNSLSKKRRNPQSLRRRKELAEASLLLSKLSRQTDILGQVSDVVANQLRAADRRLAGFSGGRVIDMMHAAIDATSKLLALRSMDQDSVSHLLALCEVMKVGKVLLPESDTES